MSTPIRPSAASQTLPAPSADAYRTEVRRYALDNHNLDVLSRDEAGEPDRVFAGALLGGVLTFLAIPLAISALDAVGGPKLDGLIGTLMVGAIPLTLGGAVLGGYLTNRHIDGNITSAPQLELPTLTAAQGPADRSRAVYRDAADIADRTVATIDGTPLRTPSTHQPSTQRVSTNLDVAIDRARYLMARDPEHDPVAVIRMYDGFYTDVQAIGDGTLTGEHGAVSFLDPSVAAVVTSRAVFTR